MSLLKCNFWFGGKKKISYYERKSFSSVYIILHTKSRDFINWINEYSSLTHKRKIIINKCKVNFTLMVQSSGFSLLFV